MHAATEQDPVWSLYCRNIYNFTKIIYMMFTATFFNKSMKERKEREREKEREIESEKAFLSLIGNLKSGEGVLVSLMKIILCSRILTRL